MKEGKVTGMDIDLLFSKLDEGLDDLENGKVISEEDMWAELVTIEDTIKEAKDWAMTAGYQESDVNAIINDVRKS